MEIQHYSGYFRLSRHKEMTFTEHRVCMQKLIIEHLSSVTTVYDSNCSKAGNRI